MEISGGDSGNDSGERQRKRHQREAGATIEKGSGIIRFSQGQETLDRQGQETLTKYINYKIIRFSQCKCSLNLCN